MKNIADLFGVKLLLGFTAPVQELMGSQSQHTNYIKILSKRHYLRKVYSHQTDDILLYGSVVPSLEHIRQLGKEGWFAAFSDYAEQSRIW